MSGMGGDDETTASVPRVGTYADLARRIDRMEQKHEDLAKEVGVLTATTSQIVLNQKHAEELNELRFGALTTSVNQIGTDLKLFVQRIEAIMSGEIETQQSKQGRALIADFTKWRSEVDDTLDKQEVRNGQIDLIGKVVWGLIGGNIIAIVGFIVWLANGGAL